MQITFFEHDNGKGTVFCLPSFFVYVEVDARMEYRTIAAPVSASFVEKKSEFIAHLFPVRTQEDAIETIEEVRRQHRRARHNVYAYLLREGNASRYSDDGEPQGTAGMPILEVLQKNELTDICCVVTRYFGGVLLGANGLVRAYSHSTALAIEAARIKHMLPCYPVSIQMDYALYGKIAYHLPQEDILQLDTIFEDQVEVKLLVRDSLWDNLKQELIDLTSGQVEIISGRLQYADFSGTGKR